LTDVAVLAYLCIYLRDDDPVQVEACRRNTSEKWLFIIDCATCWIECWIINVQQGIGITLNELYLQTVGFFCRRTTVDVSVLAALTTLLLSLGTAITGTVTNKATNTTYHNMPQQCREITGQTEQTQS